MMFNWALNEYYLSLVSGKKNILYLCNLTFLSEEQIFEHTIAFFSKPSYLYFSYYIFYKQ